MLTKLQTPHGALQLPAFLPDGTRGVVRAVAATDLIESRVQAVQMNVFHLMQRPGSSTIRALGGLHRMTGWSRPIFTDSGGFQVYSLIRQNPNWGAIGEQGVTFRPEGGSRKFKLTPEKSIQLQLNYGADVVICLDDCTHPDDPLLVQRESVARTVAWARRCRIAFDRLLAEKGLDSPEAPLLLAVIQGGNVPDLRRRCAQELMEIGFAAFGYGGWPLDGKGNLMLDMLAFVRELVPARFPLHALGVGQPANVLTCARLGYNLFDSTMPTRDARNGRLYAFTRPPEEGLMGGSEWYRYLYVKDKKHIKQDRPISPYCDCPVCRHYSLGYLHHLYRLSDHLYPRLATMHNLRFMTRLMATLRQDEARDARG